MANLIPKAVKKEQTDAWVAETWKVCLLKNTYSPDASHVVYADVSAHEITGTGYTAGGASMLPASKSSAYSGNDAVLDASDVAWTGATFTSAARYAVCYETTGNKIRGIFDLGSDYTVTAATFTLVWSASGLIKVLTT